MSAAPTTKPWPTTYSAGGLVCSVDHLASSAGAELLAAGGSAADAAIAASAVLTVTSPHMCGMGGDLFALVHHGDGPPDALNASGRAGSGADPERLRAEGHREMPFKGDVRSAPVPGCVDGWVALHERHGSRPLAEVLAPAHRLAEGGFPAAPMLAFTLDRLVGVEGCEELTTIRPGIGDRVRRPGVARQLAAVADGGREAFYDGEFGTALLEAGRGEYSPADLQERYADWVEPLGLRVWDHDLWTIPPNSQGYLALAGARIAELAAAGEPFPSPDDAAWAHLLVESARLAGRERHAELHEHADGAALLADARLRALAGHFDPHGPSGASAPAQGGGTIYLCAVDGAGMGVSLIQSNADGYGSHVAAPGTGILLHNRGIGFSLAPGHPAEYGPGRRPPHTLAPAVATRPDGTLRAVFGTMGGDSQPQVVLQLAARLLAAGQEPGDAVAAPRFVLSAGEHGFSTWTGGAQRARIEAHAPDAWAPGLTERGHDVEVAGFDPAGFGHAHAIEVRADGIRAGAADPRAMTGAAVASV
ncbi:gamma-glutamyltransferase [Aquihabitans sp. G128]|uniref:gamma-glutamyltransferase family protein n=1 Tax=Aquihabitans sp. G128 TaxID=2849779 RepID=UPI001C23CFC4|nr:gamma-glutamyltransferase [Aquihabitans sp. G128]QXC59514.1 gamma-glutamyltransferase [Aquihabitans sp. G128]